MYWLCVVQSVRLYKWSSPVAFARTDNSGRPIPRRHPLILIVRRCPGACAPRPRRDRAVCACTHYLVFKEPTADAPMAPRRLSWLASPARCLGYPEVPVPPPGSRPGRPRRLSAAARLGEPSKVTRAHHSCQSQIAVFFCGRGYPAERSTSGNAAAEGSGRRFRGNNNLLSSRPSTSSAAQQRALSLRTSFESRGTLTRCRVNRWSAAGLVAVSCQLSVLAQQLSAEITASYDACPWCLD
jgi:hypothetical protein